MAKDVSQLTGLRRVGFSGLDLAALAGLSD
jgi:hypothetical protein